MKNYYRIMLGKKSENADEAFKGNFIGAGFIHDRDLTQHLPDNWKKFNKEFIPVYLEKHPDKTKIAAGLACGKVWTVAKGIQVGDVVLCPDGRGNYYAGEVTGGYLYAMGQSLPHRRPVRWISDAISRDNMSDSLRNSTGSRSAICEIGEHSRELEFLISGIQTQIITTTDETIEDRSVFAIEKQLEDFLIQNWKSTELGKHYDIYEEEGEVAGQQYPSDTGPIDILAISKNKKELLVVELKKGRASDAAVGQLQRYMGYVKEELADPNQIVRGAIIASEDDLRIKRALSVASNIDFYTYKVSFKLEKQ